MGFLSSTSPPSQLNHFKMQTFATFFATLSLALASVSASPIMERAGTILVAAQPDYTRSVSINVRFPDTGFREVFFGLEEGSDVLVSQSSDGTGESTEKTQSLRRRETSSNLILSSVLDFTNSTVTKFDFYESKSTYLRTQYDGNYGLLRPQGDTNNCVQSSECQLLLFLSFPFFSFLSCIDLSTLSDFSGLHQRADLLLPRIKSWL